MLLARRTLRILTNTSHRLRSTTTTTSTSSSSSSSSPAGFAAAREREFAQLAATQPGWTPYAARTPRLTHSVGDFHREFAELVREPSQRLEERQVTTAGRVTSRRSAGRNMVFLDIVSECPQRKTLDKLQVMCRRNDYSPHAPFELPKLLREGDVVAVTGFPWRTKVGELSIAPREVALLAPCMVAEPETLVDKDIRFRRRHLDMRVNADTVRPVLQTRVKVLRTLRSFLEARGFCEVETPVLWHAHGGAAARPFETTSVALGEDIPLRMRVAPELFLKQLVVGGMERVFEVARVFRNEGMDATHSPEFTNCEFYQAYATYEDLMVLTEELLRQLVRDVAPRGLVSDELTLSSHGCELDFASPFRRLDVTEALHAKFGASNIPDLNDEASIPALKALCEAHGICIDPPFTLKHLVDKLIGVIESECVQPTFLINHPVSLSPLAKSHPELPGRTERFELFVAGREICNAYSELNDPQEQRRRFALEKPGEDAEAHTGDETFCDALDCAMPPTAGWGMGVERVTMLLTDSRHIRDTMFFPIMRPEDDGASGAET